MTQSELATGIEIKDIKSGEIYSVDRLPSKKLRSIGTTRKSDGNSIFIYVRELKSFERA